MAAIGTENGNGTRPSGRELQYLTHPFPAGIHKRLPYLARNVRLEVAAELGEPLGPGRRLVLRTRDRRRQGAQRQ